MARIPLGALTTLNLATQVDPQLVDLYDLRELVTTPGYAAAAPRMLFGSGGVIASIADWATASAVNFPLANPSIRLGIGYTAADHAEIQAHAAGVARDITFNRFGGNLGIGVSPGAKLDILSGAVRLRMSDSTTTFLFDVFNAAASAWTTKKERASDFQWNISGSATGIAMDASGHIASGVDNTQTMGTAAKRWSVVYAGTGTINTSDAREKTAIKQLDAAEIAAAKQLAREIGSFRFLSAISAKADDARLHIGMTVQRVMEVMDRHGLDPLRYAFICRDSWPADGDASAGDRYGFRADELMLFIARGFEARLTALEAA